MIARRLEDIRAALMLLTRLPVPSNAAPPDLARSVWAYPLIGALVGAIGAATYGAASLLGLYGGLTAALAMLAMLIATGAFHEDGLADTADALGGGQSRKAKLEIMHDSRIGTYGAAALFFALLIRWSALSALAPADAMLALVILGAVSRGLIIAIIGRMRPARHDGMGTVAADPPRWAVTTGLLFAFAPALLWGVAGASVLIVMLAAGTLLALLAQRQVGGYSGDILGAAQQVSECAGLIALVAIN